MVQRGPKQPNICTLYSAFIDSLCSPVDSTMMLQCSIKWVRSSTMQKSGGVLFVQLLIVGIDHYRQLHLDPVVSIVCHFVVIVSQRHHCCPTPSHTLTTHEFWKIPPSFRNWIVVKCWKYPFMEIPAGSLSFSLISIDCSDLLSLSHPNPLTSEWHMVFSSTLSQSQAPEF